LIRSTSQHTYDELGLTCTTLTGLLHVKTCRGVFDDMNNMYFMFSMRLETTRDDDKDVRALLIVEFPLAQH